MNQTALKKRYGLTMKQLSEAIQANLAEFNQDGEHAVMDGSNHWELDEIGVARLDEYLHYVPDLPAPANDTSKAALKAENEQLKAKIEEMTECILKAEKKFKETTQKHNREKKEYEKQLEELTRQVCDTQEGQKNLQDNLIRKYKNAAEKANLTLKYEQEKANDKIASQDKLIKELQSREEDYNDKLRKFLDLRNEYLKLQTEMTISDEEQQKLLKDLREKNDYISKLEDVIHSAKQTNNDNAMVNSLLVKDVNFAMKGIISIISTLQNSVEDHGIDSDVKINLTNEIDAVSNRQRKLLSQGNEELAQESEAVEEEAPAEDDVAPETAEATEAAQDDSTKEKAEAPVNEAPAPELVAVAPKAKGPEKLKEENEPLDAAINVLRQSQEKEIEKIQVENERKSKGILSKVASWFLA